MELRYEQRPGSGADSSRKPNTDLSIVGFETLAAVEPPVWAGLMATFVRNRGFSVDVLDAEAEELEPGGNGDTSG